MEWKARKKKVKEPKKFPEYGERKEKIKFALFPKKVQDKWIWWEKYISVLEFTRKEFTEEVEVSSGLAEDIITATGLVNSRTRTKTTTWNSWDEVERKRIS